MSQKQLLTYKPAPATQPPKPQGETLPVIELPQPDLRSGLPLMAALSFRSSTRDCNRRGSPADFRRNGYADQARV